MGETGVQASYKHKGVFNHEVPSCSPLKGWLSFMLHYHLNLGIV